MGLAQARRPKLGQSHAHPRKAVIPGQPWIFFRCQLSQDSRGIRIRIFFSFDCTVIFGNRLEIS